MPTEVVYILVAALLAAVFGAAVLLGRTRDRAPGPRTAAGSTPPEQTVSTRQEPLDGGPSEVAAPVAEKIARAPASPGESMTVPQSNDLPITSAGDDRIGLASSCRGLAEFVRQCPTPMTVAVQGDWGSGKTSAMKLMAADLEAADPAVPAVQFNTWQYTQFDLGEDLVFHLIRTIITSVDAHEEAARGPSLKQRRDKFLRKVWRATSEAGRASFMLGTSMAVHQASGGLAGKTYDTFITELFAADDEGSTRPEDGVLGRTGYLEQMRTEFQSLVAENNKRFGSDRTVIFIDDLDRLRPARAVEVMEVLKSILDVKGCVFVLAIDFAVVAQGVREKYGDSMGAEKANAFFDKIIQVPFNLPVHNYRTADLLDEYLDLGADERATADELISWSIRRNPRALKRAINAVSLSAMVQAANETPDSPAPSGQVTTLALLAASLLQAAYPRFSQLLDSLDGDGQQRMLNTALELADTLDADEVERIMAGKENEPETLEGRWPGARWGIPPSEVRSFLRFIPRYAVAAGITGDNETEHTVDRERMEKVMRATAITAERRDLGAGSRAGGDDLASRIARQAERGVSQKLLEQVGKLERHLEASGVFGKEVAKGDGWRWYVPARPDGRPMTMAHVVFPRDPVVTFYVGNRAGQHTERVEQIAVQIAQETGWSLTVSQKSSIFLHFTRIPADHDLSHLVPLLDACYRSADVALNGPSPSAS